MKAVFDTRPETSYDDDIVRRYHFPNRYLAEARKSVGDWIIYREPQRGGGRRGYIGVAHVTDIEADSNDTASSYALVSLFLPFDTVVPLRREKGYYETWLNEIADRSRIGFRLQGKSIRTIGRIDRLGQRHDVVHIVNLHYEDTVETDVYRALGSRINVFEVVVGPLQPILHFATAVPCARACLMTSSGARWCACSKIQHWSAPRSIGDWRRLVPPTPTSSARPTWGTG